MDLAALDTSTRTAVLTVVHPSTGKPIEAEGGPVTITLADQDHERLRTTRRAQQNRRLASRAKGQKLTAEAFEDDALELLCAATMAWSDIVLDGKQLACNASNAKLLYERLPWLKDQVIAFIEDRANFMSASATT